jgi:hypothetical protein
MAGFVKRNVRLPLIFGMCGFLGFPHRNVDPLAPTRRRGVGVVLYESGRSGSVHSHFLLSLSEFSYIDTTIRGREVACQREMYWSQFFVRACAYIYIYIYFLFFYYYCN